MNTAVAPVAGTRPDPTRLSASRSAPARPGVPPNTPGRPRVHLLSSCAAGALLVVVGMTARPALADSGNPCVITNGTACAIISIGPTGQNGPSPGFDRNGKPGDPGTSGGNLSHAFSDPTSYAAVSGEPAIAVLSTGGNGGNGSNASEGWIDLNGGTGGTGAVGGNINITMSAGQATSSTAAAALVASSNGGMGGSAGRSSFGGSDQISANGGAGGTMAVTINAPVQAGASAASVVSVGGNGGLGINANADNYDGIGGGAGGAGGTVTVTVGSTIKAYSTGQAAAGDRQGIMAKSAGGNGSNGGNAQPATLDSSGGAGGNGGDGGPVTVAVAVGGSVSTGAVYDGVPAIVAQSLGGLGGAGGKGPDGGNAGNGGAGGNITVTNNGTVTTVSINSPGILAQTLGGAGSDGGKGGSWIGGGGGGGASGGNGGNIAISGATGAIGTTAANSSGILAQSIGGGGGNGGDAKGWQSVGGDGGSAANGGGITINIANQVATSGDRSAGIAAQSIGGGGGNGGDVRSTGVLVNLVIGGTAGGGGAGGPVLASGGGSIQTQGAHSAGLVLQSIGGGGGNGGAAYGKDVSGVFGLQVSVGGAGGSGGAGGTIGQVPNPNDASTPFATNLGQIRTAGADSFGILGQSIGGGGGVGGASAATAKTYAVSSDPPLPTISVAVSLGGSGGSGGGGGPVTLANAGLIATSGQGSAGIVAQSVGGGGGSGGDASATSTAKGGDSPISISSSVSLGGHGAGAGDGSSATIANTGLILTTGESADGILAQSIGGGGGNGGAGDGKATSTGDNTTISVTLNMGGASGGGGNGGSVAVTNGGSILTLGDGASGIMAQAIGGGGGRGGGAAGTGNGAYSATVNLGGSGGGGGNTWNGGTPTNPNTAVTVTNTGSIVTFGADAPGIVAQSVAGGGGVGGKAASSIGSGKSTGDGGNGNNGPVSTTVAQLSSAFTVGGAGALAQYNSIVGLTGLANGLLGNAPPGTLRLGNDPASDAAGLENLGSSAGNSGDGSKSTSITIGVGVGGRGGSGGDAGVVSVTNGGSIGTVGAMSDGILAQSIGGGGGKGGAATSSTTDNDVQGSISVGGTGGSGGNGGTVTVSNTGSIVTIGGLSAGIVTQSISGGGGIGGTSGAKVKPDNNSGSSVLSVPIAIGGSGGSGNFSNQVTVSNAGNILTRSHDAIGIVAQSIAGGGGIVKTLSTDPADNNGGGASATGGDYGINLTFGGKGGASGNAGAVTVQSTGSIATSGGNAYGILAQSIGGGGGLVLGGKPNGSSFFGSGRASGSGEAVQVTVDGIVATIGQGAVGVLAQSIGGGGGLAGDTGRTSQRAGFTPSPNRTGDGGPVTIGIGQTGTVTTNALNTPAIFAQSIGGGGGRVANNAGAFSGTAGGSGSGGAVAIDVAGRVSALGAASPGIYAESVGAGAPPAGFVVKVSVAQGAVVSGGTDFNAGDGYGAGIYVVSGGQGANNANTITNSGTITSVNGTAGTAIYSTGGYTSVVNNAGGTITGAINLQNGGGGGTVVNNAGGTLLPGSTVNLGASGRLVNNGLIMLGGRPGQAAPTTVTGSFEQTATGVLRVNLQAGANTAGALQVNGAARVAGNVDVVVVDPANLKPGARHVNVLSATGGVAAGDARLTSVSTPVVSYSLTAPDAGTLNLGYTVDYGGARALQAKGLASSNRGEVGRALNANLTGNAGGLTPLAGRLAALPTAQAVAATLDSLSGEAAADVQQTVFAQQQAYTRIVLRHVVGEDRGEEGTPGSYAVTALGPLAGPPANNRGMRVWVGSFGGNDVLSGTDGQGSLHTQVAGALMGVDKWFDRDRMAGVSVGGGTSDFGVADRASQGHTTALNLDIHGLARVGRAYVAAVLAYGNFSTDLKRNALGGATGLTAAGRGSVTSNVLGGRVEAGWNQPLGGGGLMATPFAALGVDHLWQSSFSETVVAEPGGSGLGLRFGGTERTSVPLTLGARLGSAFRLWGGHVLGVSAELGWQHEFNPQRSVTAAFQAAPDTPFRVLGVSASRDSALTALDAKLSLTQNVALLGSFTGRFSGVETAVGGFGGLQVTW